MRALSALWADAVRWDFKRYLTRIGHAAATIRNF